MQIFGLRKGNDIAIDLGNSNTVLANIDRSLSHPSLVVLSKKDNTLKAVGTQAFEMLGKVQENLKVVKPMKEGLIADFNSTKEMLKAMVALSYPKNNILSGIDHLIAGVPFASNEVERRALRDALEQFKASKTFLIYEPIAAALGIGLDITEPDGKFVVDIGGGITEAVVISLSGIVNHQAIKVAGERFDEEILLHIKKEYNIDLGSNMAEQVKIRVGAATGQLDEPPPPFDLVGKDCLNGIPKRITLDHGEIAHVLDRSILQIEQAIIQALEDCPPELAGDIYANGIHLTGGGSLLRGLKERIVAKLRIPVHQDAEALCSVARGMMRVLREPGQFQTVLFK